METAAVGQTARQCWQLRHEASFSGAMKGRPSSAMAMMRAGQSLTQRPHLVQDCWFTVN
jgi:hypothetical protein